MVNSSTSKIIYVGAYVMGGIVLIGIILLSTLTRPIPDQLWSLLASIGTFLMGAHIKAPVTQLYPDESTASVVKTTVTQDTKTQLPIVKTETVGPTPDTKT